MRNMLEMSYKVVFIARHGKLFSFSVSLLSVLCKYRQFVEVVTFHHKICIRL
jgi:hypothetical protein